MNEEDYKALRTQYEDEVFLCKRKLVATLDLQDKMFWIAALEFWCGVLAELDIKALIGAYCKVGPPEIYAQLKMELEKREGVQK